MPLTKTLTTATFALFVGVLAGCGDDSDGDAPPIQEPPRAEVDPTRLHLLAAPEGTLVLTEPQEGQRRTGTLELQEPYPHALWYADRPGRDVGSRPLADYVGLDWDPTYAAIPPNATLQFHTGDGPELEGMYLSLSQPSYNRERDSLVFQVKVLDDTIIGELPAQLPLSGLTLNILNNSQDDQEVASYVQHAGIANLQPAGGGAGGHRLVLQQAHDEMFWVDNAPGTYSDRRPISEFMLKWPHDFAEDPPNAALVGTNTAGELKVYFATLEEPEYEADEGKLSYSVTLLGAAPGTQDTLSQVALLIDTNTFARFPLPGKGAGYQAFSQGYDPSTANTSYIYFGSDIARKQTGSLWGTQSYLHESCASDCRNDLLTIKQMGTNLIRLYDWDPRNDHSQFLNYAHDLGIKVLVPISNWLPSQDAGTWAQQLPAYFSAKNFGNADGTDWHPAIAGVIISNELDPPDSPTPFTNVIGLMAAFLQKADSLGFGQSMLVGAPVTFGLFGAQYPSWHAFDQMVSDARLQPYLHRLMLCPQTYNDRDYLFTNAEGSGKGWVDLTWEKYQLPILFTEIGRSRTGDPDAQARTLAQLQGVIEYQTAHPEHLLGAAHFLFSNKVWLQTPNDSISEGSFGSFSHGEIVRQIVTTQSDYDFYDPQPNQNWGTLVIDTLVPTVTHTAVVEAYQ